MDWRVWRSLDKAKGLLNISAIVKPFDNRRKAASLSGGIQYSSKLGTDQGRGWCVKAGALYQPSIPRSQSELPKAREDCLCPLQKTLPLLLGTSHHCHDKPTDKEDDEQDRCSRATRPMGHRAWPVQHRIGPRLQSKPMPLPISLQSSLTLKKKKSPQRRHR